MKILYCVDVENWAIGHLAQAKIKHNSHYISKLVAVHPRDVSIKADDFVKQVKEFDPDVIVYEYFRSCAELIKLKPELKKYKSILVHHNQRDKSLFYADWNELGIHTIVTHTSKCRVKLESKGYTNVITINHGINFDNFPYAEKEPEEKTIGYVGRVVPWKGLKEIAMAAKELNYPVMMMGKIDKADYWNQVPKESLRYDFMECSDEERIEAYRNMTIYVGFSEDNYEEGTLPFLEAMASGVPIVTTLNGVANDIIQDEYNALVVDFKDYEGLKKQIKRLMEDSELRKTLRRNAWNTVKLMTEQKMAYEYSKLFHKILFKKDEPLFSVIIPTYNRKEQVLEILYSLENQTYKHIEAVICDDDSDDGTGEMVMKFKEEHPRMIVKYINTKSDGYNLARARNMGAIEAEGKYLLFCDSRLKPDQDSILMFKEAFNQLKETDRVWLFGDKGGQKQSFVENFSCVKREHFMVFGMFNEQISEYGGMSQEIRTRWIEQEGQVSYVPSAIAEQMLSSSLNEQKRKSIIKMKFLLYKMFNDKRH